MTICFYRTKCLGGVEGRDLIVTNWVSEEAARAAALEDTWNEDYTLYIVQFIFASNGQLIEDEARLEKIPCGRDRLRG